MRMGEYINVMSGAQFRLEYFHYYFLQSLSFGSMLPLVMRSRNFSLGG